MLTNPPHFGVIKGEGAGVITQGNRKELAAGYTRSHRWVERVGIAYGLAAMLLLATRAFHAPARALWHVPYAFACGLLFADFQSGLLHWACDTWGRVSMRLVGPLVLRTFREHHVDEKAITRHDFVETNGLNFALAGGLSSTALASLDLESAFSAFCGTALLFGAMFIAMTSQIHKWAHAAAPPRLVLLLQRSRLILGPRHHEGHHDAPFTQNYCITAGLLDAPLAAVGFWRTLERVITFVTGMVPREDDVGREAALETMHAGPALPSEAHRAI